MASSQPASRWLNGAVVRELAISLLLLLFVFGVYIGHRGVIQSSDSRWTLHLAMSVLRAGDANLDEYAKVIGEGDYRVYHYGGHLFSLYPIGTPLLIIPLLYLAEHLATPIFGIDLYQYMTAAPPDLLIISLDLALASAITALASVVMVQVGRFFLDAGRAVLLALIFAFATSAWSTASRGLWQHGPSMLVLALALYVVLAASSRPWLIQWLGPLLAVAYVIRPANSIAVLLFTIYVLVYYRTFFVYYMGWACVIALPFFWYNYTVSGAILPPYYLPEGVGGNPHFWNALAGTLISPSRGLLIYSPVFLLSGLGVLLKIRHKQFDGLDTTLVSIMLLHWLMVASWRIWWGGTSYGPRLFTDMMPYLVYFMIPVLAALPAPRTPLAAAYLVTCAMLVLVSVAIHYRGATAAPTWLWNEESAGGMAGVDQDPDRVWSWSDPQFLRGLDVAPGPAAP